MTRKYIRNFSAEYKTKIVLELLESEETISQLSKKYEITAKTIQNWKKQFINNASMAFEPAKVVSEYKAEIEELKAQNDELAKARANWPKVLLNHRTRRKIDRVVRQGH